MRKLLITLVILGAVLVAADYGLRWIATTKISDAVASQLRLAAAPEVKIAGFPFTWQAISGRYDDVSITVPNLSLGPVTGVDADLTLRDTTIGLSDAVAGNIDAMVAGAADLIVTLPVSSLAAALRLTGLAIATAPDGALAISSTIALAGQSIPVTGILQAKIVDSVVQLRVGSLSAVGLAAPPQLLAAAGAGLGVDLPLTAVPFRIDAASVSAVGGNVVITGAASNVRVADLRK
ncbi:DUF2993 domain-containing protein [Nakamurella antarctica]|nr:DUF2993 domain-containing protein [Nakamurella antarctica]